MRSVHALGIISSLVAALTFGCGSGDSSPTPGSNPVSSGENTSSGDSAEKPPAPTNLAINGEGSIYEGEDQVCSSTGSTTTGACTALYQKLVSAVPASGWWFDHWDPSGSVESDLAITLATPPAITAVFVPIGTVRDSGPPGSGPAR